MKRIPRSREAELRRQNAERCRFGRLCADLYHWDAIWTPAGAAADDSCFIGHFYHPGRAAGHRHHCHGAGRTTHGKAPSTGAQAASRGDPGQRFRHLLR